MDGAGAAECGSAAELGPGHAEHVAEGSEQRHLRGNVELTGLPVDGELWHVLRLPVAGPCRAIPEKSVAGSVPTRRINLANSCLTLGEMWPSSLEKPEAPRPRGPGRHVARWVKRRVVEDDGRCSGTELRPVSHELFPSEHRRADQSPALTGALGFKLRLRAPPGTSGGGGRLPAGRRVRPRAPRDARTAHRTSAPSAGSRRSSARTRRGDRPRRECARL